MTMQKDDISSNKTVHWFWSGSEYERVGSLEATLRDGTVITATVQNADDMQHWEVREDGFLIAFGECNDDTAQHQAERVICYGATKHMRRLAQMEMQRRGKQTVA